LAEVSRHGTRLGLVKNWLHLGHIGALLGTTSELDFAASLATRLEFRYRVKNVSSIHA